MRSDLDGGLYDTIARAWWILRRMKLYQPTLVGLPKSLRAAVPRQLIDKWHPRHVAEQRLGVCNWANSFEASGGEDLHLHS